MAADSFDMAQTLIKLKHERRIISKKDVLSKRPGHDGSEKLLFCLPLIWFQCSIEGIKGTMIQRSWCISPNCDIVHLPKIVHLIHGGTTVSWPVVPSCALAALFPVK